MRAPHYLVVRVPHEDTGEEPEVIDGAPDLNHAVEAVEGEIYENDIDDPAPDPALIFVYTLTHRVQTTGVALHTIKEGDNW
jgi:hypothetical protein